MLIWISMFLIFGVLAILGFYQGAVRFLVSLAGMLAGAVLAPVGSIFISPVLSWVGVKHPVWMTVLSLLIAFGVVYMIGLALAEFVHRKVEHYFKYKAEDLTRIRWERLNRRLGIPLGLVTAAAWILPLSLVVYVTGYPTLQLSLNDNATGVYNYINSARQSLQSTGLDKTASRFDPMPEQYYEISDLLGLLYQNPILMSRLAKYPPFLRAGEDAALTTFGSDKEYMDLLLSKGDIAQIVQHPNTIPLLTAGGAYMAATGVELKDLHEYLKTGKSAKYDNEKILGRWKINVRATIAQARKKNPDMSSTEMAGLRASTGFLNTVSLLATTDEKVILNAGQATPAEAVAAPAAEPVDPNVARYGLQGQPRGPGPRGGPTPAVAARPTTSRTVAPTLNQQIQPSQGSWKRDLDKYQLGITTGRGGPQTVEAVIEGNRLSVNHPAVTLIFDKEV